MQWVSLAPAEHAVLLSAACSHVVDTSDLGDSISIYEVG